MFDKELKILGWLILADGVIGAITDNNEGSSHKYYEFTYADIFEDIDAVDKLSKVISPDIKKVNTPDKAIEWITDKVGEDVVAEIIGSEAITDLMNEKPTSFKDVMEWFFDVFQLEDSEDLIMIYGDDVKVDDLLDYAKEHGIK